jgi:hypothetical protein
MSSGCRLSDNIYHLSARECARLGRMTDDPELQYELFVMARQWMALAMEEEARRAVTEPA